MVPALLIKTSKRPNFSSTSARGAFNRSGVGRVEQQKVRIQTRAFQFVGGFGSARLIARADENRETVIARQLARRFESDAFVGAGD